MTVFLVYKPADGFNRASDDKDHEEKPKVLNKSNAKCGMNVKVTIDGKNPDVSEQSKKLLDPLVNMEAAAVSEDTSKCQVKNTGREAQPKDLYGFALLKNLDFNWLYGLG